MNNSDTNRFSLVFISLILCGCAPLGPMPSDSESSNVTLPVPNPSEPSATPSAARRDSNSRILSPTATANQMLLQARVDRAAGRLDSAESKIERALRIEPNNPWLWIELGEINLAAGNRAQARTMGNRAVSLAGGDPLIELNARRLTR